MENLQQKQGEEDKKNHNRVKMAQVCKRHLQEIPECCRTVQQQKGKMNFEEAHDVH